MVPEDDARHTLEFDAYYVIMPAFDEWDTHAYMARHPGKLCRDGFRYGSDTNTRWLTVEELRAMVGSVHGETDDKTGN